MHDACAPRPMRACRLTRSSPPPFSRWPSQVHDGFFVDLFVRKSNSVAIGMYEKFGYIKYREVLGYYSGEENAYDMRKAMPRDVHKKSVIPLKRPIKPEELEFD
jgi:N-terminal acetyltransferase B complex catalytic subunit